LATDGTLSLNFAGLGTAAPFDDATLRLELLNRFNRVLSSTIPGSLVGARPTLPLGMIGRPVTSERFIDVVDWVGRTASLRT